MREKKRLAANIFSINCACTHSIPLDHDIGFFLTVANAKRQVEHFHSTSPSNILSPHTSIHVNVHIRSSQNRIPSSLPSRKRTPQNKTNIPDSGSGSIAVGKWTVSRRVPRWLMLMRKKKLFLLLARSNIRRMTALSLFCNRCLAPAPTHETRRH